MAKSRKEILLELLELEGQKDRSLGESEEPAQIAEQKSVSSETVSETKREYSDTPLTKPKKALTEKQLEALKRGQEKRNANREARAEAKRQEEEMKKKQMEEKLVKKAIAVKKKQLKREEMLDEISDDETPSKPSVPLTKVKTVEKKIPVENIRPAHTHIIRFF